MVRTLLARACARGGAVDAGEQNGPVLAALVLAAALCERSDAFLRRAPQLKGSAARELLPAPLWLCWELSAPMHANPGGAASATPP
jgi:hypothetical protein